MDQNEFSRRLLLLAGVQNPATVDTGDDYTRILGSLGLVCSLRRAQAVLLCGLLGLGAFAALHAIAPSSKSAVLAMALLLAGVSLVILRRFPYWTPAGPLSDGLHTLSRFTLNDLGEFIRNQRTDLSAVNNTLLNDLCMQLAMDRRRPKAEPLDHQGTQNE